MFDRSSDVDLETSVIFLTSDWYFQMVFVATVASIVSGALAERILIWPFFFVAILTALIYPIAGSWQWGGGWLSEWAFLILLDQLPLLLDGALAGAMLLGARDGKYGADGTGKCIYQVAHFQ